MTTIVEKIEKYIKDEEMKIDNMSPFETNEYQKNVNQGKMVIIDDIMDIIKEGNGD